MKPQRIQRKRTKGWKMPPNTVSVTRPGLLGNPFVVGIHGTHEECVALHRDWLAGYLQDEEIDRRFEASFAWWLKNNRHPTIGHALRILPGSNVACWCSLERSCHADTLLEIANSAAP